MTDDTSVDTQIPGYDPATGEIHDDPELEPLPNTGDGNGNSGDLLGGSETSPFDQMIPFDPEGQSSEGQGEGDPVHGDSFVAEHPEMFGGEPEPSQQMEPEAIE